MITFVYCVCLLIVCSRTAKIESEENDFNNDYPYTSAKIESLSYRVGADILLKCNSHFHKDNITWEFKRCKTNLKGIQCDYQSKGQWEKSHSNRKGKKLEIKNATEEDVGLYRCLYNDSIIKIYRVDLVVAPKYIGPKPEILLLEPSNATTNTIVIHCKATSVTPAEIRWFKECFTPKCDMPARLSYNGHCYCPFLEMNYAASVSNDTYTSKLSISNTAVSSGTYVCIVISAYGEDHANVTVTVDDVNRDIAEDSSNSFSLLFLIPLFFVLVPVTIWLGFYKGKTKSRRQFYEQDHQKQLIKPVVEL